MRERHPYGEFIPKKPRAMIVGSFPIGKFSNPKRRHEIKDHEFDFFFGGEKNLLWKLLGEVFKRKITSKEDIVSMLTDHGLAVGDVICSCKRKAGGGSDSDLYDIEWNKDLLHIIQKHGIKTVYFTSKKVEIWFKKLFPHSLDIQMITLISPSGQSIRSLYHRPDYQVWNKTHPKAPKMDFILKKYREDFHQLVR